MRIGVLLIGLMLVLVGVMAANVPGPTPMAQDTIQTYRDANFTIQGTVFKDGATVYVKVWDGENNGSRTQPRVTNWDSSAFIDFYAYDDGTNLDNETDFPF